MTGDGTEPRRLAVIVGGSGFVGRRLSARLSADGTPVRVLDLERPTQRAGLEWVACDIRDTESLRQGVRGASVVYNLCAAHGVEQHSVERYTDLNVRGAESLCAAAAAEDVSRIIFTSTAAVYGVMTNPAEDTTCHPKSEYARSKLRAESIYRDWADASARHSLTIVRPTVIFGPGGNGAGERLIRFVGDPSFSGAGPGHNRKSLAYVDNVAAFLAFLAHRLPDGAETQLFNYADQPDPELSEIIAIVRSALFVGQAPRRSYARVVVGSVGRSIASKMTRRAIAPPRLSRQMLRRLADDIRFDARRAHATGFAQPMALVDALAETARAELGWLRWSRVGS